MAPRQSRKRKSESMEGDCTGPAVSTPIGHPTQKKTKITQPQKQALIDNLQLEITERARHLRAHYALQGTDLRSRIERRINRIPISLRGANMGHLLSKHLEATIAKEMPSLPRSTEAPPDASQGEASKRPLPAAPSGKPSSKATKPGSARQLPPTRGTKRRSSEILILSDKENEPVMRPDPVSVSNPKNAKRAKTAASTTAKRAASRTAKAPPTNVLSPKSHNSRTLPRSPIKDATVVVPQSPSKLTYMGRPTSPLKPASPLKFAASAATNAISASLHGMVAQAKRGAANTTSTLRRTASKEKFANGKGRMAPPPRPTAAPQQQQQQQQPIGISRPDSQASTHSTSSISSATSSATTVVTRKTTTAGKGGAKKTTVKAANTTTKKPTTRKATNATAAAKAGKASALKGANHTAAEATAAKKVVVAEPAAGKRVLRRRN